MSEESFANISQTMIPTSKFTFSLKNGQWGHRFIFFRTFFCLQILFYKKLFLICRLCKENFFSHALEKVTICERRGGGAVG